MSKVYAHLISDSTGDTVSAVSRAVFAKFNDIDVKYYTWALIVTKSQIERIIKIVKRKRGVILHTISDPEMSSFLKHKCEETNIVCIGAIEQITEKIAHYLDQKPTVQVGRSHILDEEYFKRIEAINYTIMHDDGQSPDTLNEADIILIGPSRTTKSPTSMYLAYKGFKTANIPFILEVKFELNFEETQGAFIVGLYTSVDRLIDVRKNRLLSWNCTANTKYVSEEEVGKEIQKAKRFYLNNNIPIIDVTHNSIEETSAKIIQLYHLWKKQKARHY
ncbi:MAG: kinase/pyrophosphorylase [Rickettsiales bacterium]|nr:kinase/pyrophosphorylase [Rickettsiales bacterium]